jgi:hypothetical protein
MFLNPFASNILATDPPETASKKSANHNPPPEICQENVGEGEIWKFSPLDPKLPLGNALVARLCLAMREAEGDLHPFGDD